MPDLESPPIVELFQPDDMRPRIAVIGAGLAGSVAARKLAEAGLDVTIFDKGRSVGGRMATRRTARTQFDHGAQYFTASDDQFQSQVEAWCQQGVAAVWNGPFVVFDDGRLTGPAGGPPRYVGCPDMKAPSRQLCHELRVNTDTPIESITVELSGQVRLHTQTATLGAFDSVVLALPPAQAEPLASAWTDLSPAAAACMRPCWSVMLTLRNPIAEWSGAFVNGGPLRWMARNNTKPRRTSDVEAIVLHADYDWSEQHVDDNPEIIIEALIAAADHLLPGLRQGIESVDAHRWLYAAGEADCTQRYLADRDVQCVVCGDWLAGSKVQGAYLSGLAGAAALSQRWCV